MYLAYVNVGVVQENIYFWSVENIRQKDNYCLTDLGLEVEAFSVFSLFGH